MTETWTNWPRQQRCSPERIERPSTEAEVVEAVKRAADEGRRVRVVGAGHSFTDIACTDGVMLDLSGLDSVIDHDRATGLVRVQGGIIISALARALDERGLALENQGDIDVQAIAGALSTATHGTGSRFGNLSSRVEGVRLVDGTGEVVELDAGSDPEGLRAARVSLGALGAITEVTVRCVPAYTIRRVDDTAPLADVLANLDDHVEAHDHYEVFVFPYSDRAITLESARGHEPPPRGRANTRQLWVREVLLENTALEAAMRLGRAFPALLPSIARFLPRAASRVEKFDASWRVFASERRVRFTEIEDPSRSPARGRGSSASRTSACSTGSAPRSRCRTRRRSAHAGGRARA